MDLGEEVVSGKTEARDRKTDLVICLELITFSDAVIKGVSMILKFKRAAQQAHVALRPIGLMLTIPFLNSMNVPLRVKGEC
jgi:hypothetical protein